MNAPRERQSAYNAASRDHWDAFGPHRDRVTRILTTSIDPTTGPSGRLAVLGAGNLNDLDLPALRSFYREVHLVDLDADALAVGVSRQGRGADSGVIRHGGVDLTGMLDAIEGWGPLSTLGPADFEALADWPSTRVAPTLPGPFDAVASTCVLSQIIATLRQAVGETRADFMAAVAAIRLGHLRLLNALTAPGGRAWLVADATSTDLVPEIGGAPEAELPAWLERSARARRVFHGADPRAIRRLFAEDRVLSRQVGAMDFFPPWRWRLHGRTYLVWALGLRRDGGTRLRAAGRLD